MNRDPLSGPCQILRLSSDPLEIQSASDSECRSFNAMFWLQKKELRGRGVRHLTDPKVHEHGSKFKCRERVACKRADNA